ncbi:hypothetical protein [Stieleria mannarensis]|uniref:hypothetical protein n=1 Tax=Stieleria mannarensis TaxID=2755585 RepID=UPI0015FF3878|nr:hypothetical protein [Rhodopirellula sp. JC639]
MKPIDGKTRPSMTNHHANRSSRRRNRASRRPPLNVERLECRTLLAGDIGLAIGPEDASVLHDSNVYDGWFPAVVAPPQHAESMAENAMRRTAEAIRPLAASPKSAAAERVSLDESIDTLAADVGYTSAHPRRKAGLPQPADRPEADGAPDDQSRTDREGGMISVDSHPLPSNDTLDLAGQFETAGLEFHLMSGDSAWSDAPQSPAHQPTPLRVSNLGQSSVTASTTPPIETGPTLPQNSLPENSLPGKHLASTPASQNNDGGMIRVYSTALPTTGPTTLSSSVPIQLAPNMGHYRNFRLADAPGLDSKQDSDRSATLVSRSESGESIEKLRSKRKLRWASRLPTSIRSSVSVVSGSALLSGELQRSQVIKNR